MEVGKLEPVSKMVVNVNFYTCYAKQMQGSSAN